MSIRSGSRNTIAARGWLFRLLLAAIVVRALIPVGFMPDFSAAAQGEFKVVICTAAGIKHITLDAAGNPQPDQKAQHHEQPCAFAGLAAVAMVPQDSVQMSLPVITATPITFALSVALPPARAGPVLGSRGPPQNS